MRLREDVSFADVIDRVDHLVGEGKTLLRLCHVERGEEYVSIEILAKRSVRWVDNIERYLRRAFVDGSLIERLHARGYWQIHMLAAEHYIHPDRRGEACRLFIGEIEAHLAQLTALMERLHSYRSLGQRAGHIAVPDTNTLLHYQRLDRIDWTKIVRERPVRLVLLLLVLDELDNKKYLGSDKIIRRARSALKPMEELRPHLETSGYAQLTQFDVTVEYLVDEPGHQRITNPDEEIVDRAHFLKQVTDQPVTVVTADYGMRARAVARGLRVADMPAKYARDDHRPHDADGADTAPAASTP